MGSSALSTVTQIGFTLAGFTIGGSFGALIGAGLGAFVANQFFGEDIEVSKGRLSDLKVSLSQYGYPIPTIWGCVRLGGNAYFNSDLIEKKNTEKTGGGKGGGPSVTTTTYFYSINIGYMFCESPASFPVVAVLKIWANGKLIGDFTNQTGPIFSSKYTGEGGGPFNSGTIRIRFGDEDQEIDPLYQEVVESQGAPIDSTPADRGYCTIILDDFPLEDFGNAAPQLNALVCTAATPVFPFAQMPEWTINTRTIFFSNNGRYLTHGGTTDPPMVNSDTREFVIKGKRLQPLIGEGVNNGNNPQGFQAVDRFGRGLSWDASITTTATPFLHDIETYEVIARSENGDSGISTSGLGSTFFGDNDQRILLHGDVNLQFAVYSTSFVTAIKTSEGGTDTFTGQRIPLIRENSNWSSEGLPNISGSSMTAVDSEGSLWTGHHTGSDILLVKWDLGMQIVEQHTVTGFQVQQGDDTGLGYDAVSNSIFGIDGTQTLWKYEIDTDTTTSITLPSTTQDNLGAFRSIHNGVVYLQSGLAGGGAQAIDIPTLTVVAEYDFGDWAPAAIQSSRSPVYDPILHALIASDTTNDPVNWIFLDRAGGDPVTLEAILNNEVLRSGYEGGAADRDATDHSATLVKGWAAANQSPVVQSSEGQAEVYKFGHVESDHKIKFPARFRATTFTLTDDDLGVRSSGAEPGRKLEISRIDQSNLPVRSEITYMDPEMDYQDQLARAFLPPETVPGTDKVESRTFPVVLSNDEAKQREFNHLKLKYFDQNRYRFTTFHNNMTLDPGDTGTITSDGFTHLVMIEETSLGANFVYECTAVGVTIPDAAEANAILNQVELLDANITHEGSGFVPQQIDQVNSTRLVLLDMPFLIDEVDPGNDRLLTTIVAQRSAPGLPWGGAVIFRGLTLGELAEWHFYEEAQEGEIGLVDTILDSTENFATIDDVSSVQVIFRDDLVIPSVTDDELTQTGRNYFIVGDEVLQAGVATDGGDGRWTLTRLLRGQRGTEWAGKHLKGWAETQDHTEFEQALFLGDIADRGNADVKSINLSERNVEFVHKPVSVNLPDDTIAKLFTNTGRSHKPWAPVNVDGTKSGNDWVFTWTRRNRIGSALGTGTDLPETDPRVYEIDILNELGTVVRTLNATTETVTYTQAQQQTDFGGTIVTSYPLYRINIGVYQVNAATVGRGFVGVGHIEDFPAAPTDASFSSVNLLLHMNDLNVTDKGSKNLGALTVGSGVSLTQGDYWDITADGSTIKTNGISQFGTGALTFRLTANSFITLPRSALSTHFNLGSSNFTIEAWLRRDTLTFDGLILGIWGASGSREWKFNVAAQGTNGRIEFFYSTDGTAQTSHSGDLLTNDLGLRHVAVTREGNNLYFWSDGSRLTSKEPHDVTGVTIHSGTSTDLRIGLDSTSGNQYRGEIDSIRFTLGVARYSSASTTYTPPATMFPNQ